MKVLFTCQVGHGILHPMVPLARALDDRGHDVAFATAEGFCPWVRKLGFRAFPAGLHRGAYIEEVKAQFPQYPTGIPRPELLRFHLTQELARFAAPATASDLVALIPYWRPDLIVHDMVDLGAPVAASVCGVPYVSHGWTIRYPVDYWTDVASAVAPLWEQWGVDPGPYGGMFRHLFLDLCPPSLRSPDDPDAGPVQSIRPVPLHVALAEEAPPEVELPESEPDLPVVYFTMGTIFNKTPSLLSTTLTALAEMGIRVLADIGHDGPEECLGPYPANVTIARFLPQRVALQRCTAVVAHGGAGTMFASLGSGRPLLLLPQGIDQFHNAARCIATGVARAIDPDEFCSEAIQEGVAAVLQDPHYGLRAQEIAAQIRAMPHPNEVALALEAMV